MTTVFVFIILILWLILLHCKLEDINNTLNGLRKRIDIIEKKQDENIEIPDNICLSNQVIKDETFEDEDIFYDSGKKDDIKEYSDSENEEQGTVKNVFEDFLLGNLYTIIGSVVLIFAVGIFIKMIYPFIFFTPMLKTVIGFLVGLGFILSANYIKGEKLKTYSEILMGTGFSALFITTLCTTVLFKTFSENICILIALIILLAAYYIADKQKTISMIVISLLGGYFNILFVPNIDISLLFGYIIFLNILSVLYVYRNSKTEWINIVNLFFTLLIVSIFMIFDNNVNVIYPIALWLVYLAYDFLKTKNKVDIDKYNLLNWLNFSVLTIFSCILFQDSKLNIGITLLLVALIYAFIVVYFIKHQSEKFKPYLYSMLVTILFCIYFISEDILRLFLWSFAAVILAFLAGTQKKDYLAKWVLLFIMPAQVCLFFIEGVIISNYGSYIPIFNERLFAFSFPTLGAIISFFLMRNSENNNIIKIVQTIKFIFISVLYLYLVLELNNYIYENGILYTFNYFMLFIIIAIVYSMQMKRLSVVNNLPLYNISSNVIGFLSLITLLLLSLKDNFSYEVLFFNIRCIAYITAITASIYFGKISQKDIYYYLAVFLGFIIMTLETDILCQILYYIEPAYIYSALWLIYSGIITIVGILKNKKYLRNIGMLISIVTLLKIFFFDLKSLEMIYRLLILLMLGIVFMIISYLYNKNKN